MSFMLALFILPFAIMGILGFLFTLGSDNDRAGYPFLIFIFAPILYGVMGYVFNRFFCFIYNVIAKRFGGIEFITEEQEQ